MFVGDMAKREKAREDMFLGSFGFSRIFVPAVLLNQMNAKEKARQIAATRWCLRGGTVHGPDESRILVGDEGWRSIRNNGAVVVGMGILRLESQEMPRHGVSLHFMPGHKNVQELTNLRYGAPLRFDFVKGFGCDATWHLAIRN